MLYKCLVTMLLFTIVLCLPSGADAQKKAVALKQKWNGSIADEALQKGTPECITTKAAFARLWKKWKLPDDAPGVDFDRELVLVVTTRGSSVNLSANLDQKGNLQALGFGTRDLRDGFRFVIGVVNRAGVKTVNGKQLPKD